MSAFVWIQTRDGSPTLWHNELGESFRSVKGAFTESWTVFIEPALKDLERGSSQNSIEVGEFGLGAGTNWALWTLACRVRKISFHYTAIERDLASFELGRAKWIEMAPQLSFFLKERGFELSEEHVRETLTPAPSPAVMPTLAALTARGAQFRIWFHDPFGYEVNPDGYTAPTLELCARLWAPQFWGGSYACNRRFRETLEGLSRGLKVEVASTGDSGLKRERIEFSS